MKELPLEIIELISTNTTVHDLLDIILVSKVWYHYFYRFLYKSVCIDSQEKSHRILSAFDKQHLPGHLVRSLSLSHAEINGQQVIDTFPHIDTLVASALKLDTLLFRHYQLKHLVLDTREQDIPCILKHCPSLKRLELLHFDQQVTMNYLETIHQHCPQLTELSLQCLDADPQPTSLFDDMHDTKLVSCGLQSFSICTKSGASKWSFWLLYFAFKYPYLKHLSFKQQGNSIPSLVSDPVILDLFTQNCRHLKSIAWHSIVVRHDQAAKLYGPQLTHIQVFESFVGSHSILQIRKMAQLITSLTIGQLKTAETIQLIGTQCPSLSQLEIQQTKGRLVIQDLLVYCKRLLVLKIKCTHITASSLDIPAYSPLKQVVLQACSFEQGVFESISGSCQALKHVELLACFQSDRRDKVELVLNQQRLHTLKIQALRTRQYYPGCRIRFFSINKDWFYMEKFDVSPKGIEKAVQFDRLDAQEQEKLLPFVTTKMLKAWDIEHIKQQALFSMEDPENVYYSGIVSIQCLSIQHLLINELLLEQ
ncbi:uncharacterized protein B0P05DRAFT_563203 [Gilbertella persicaria]|uniref:F-box domain-containing protein n=1 Tax=Rhizopus stolonifer TaxID=4846 RepID=A0A367K169_RHIST|nr:uncharacterized protein B0P05DRAFT_563203 [Gilbertella persicaria]KAI8050131.1 hypothetical protein B0P05DRAFT_563203 [Gilbertella persicaria]RCH95889.1 hypothetical protein CU098_003703 [Rhizopus stolonifer]